MNGLIGRYLYYIKAMLDLEKPLPMSSRYRDNIMFHALLHLQFSEKCASNHVICFTFTSF